jgi:hypothetical protein
VGRKYKYGSVAVSSCVCQHHYAAKGNRQPLPDLPIRTFCNSHSTSCWPFYLSSNEGSRQTLAVKYTSHICSNRRARKTTHGCTGLPILIQILACNTSSIRHGTAFRAAACMQGSCLQPVDTVNYDSRNKGSWLSLDFSLNVCFFIICCRRKSIMIHGCIRQQSENSKVNYNSMAS